MKNIKLFLILIVLVGSFAFVSTTQAQEKGIIPTVDGGAIDSNGKIIRDGEVQKKVDTQSTTPATTTPKVVCDFEKEKKANPVPKEQCQQNSDLDKGLVQCGREIACEYQITTNIDGSCLVNKKVIIKTADPDKMCKFNDVITLINNIIKYILILAIPIVAIMFAYAGIMLLFSGGDPGAKTKAKEVFLNALIGLVLVVGAVLIIKTILTIVGYKDLGIFF